MEKTLDTELLSYFHSLAKPQQLNVLDYLKSLLKKTDLDSRNNGLLKLAGSISKKDLQAMREAIQEGCEQVDENEW